MLGIIRVKGNENINRFDYKMSLECEVDNIALKNAVKKLNKWMDETEEEQILKALADTNINSLIKLRDKINIILTSHGQTKSKQPHSETCLWCGKSGGSMRSIHNHCFEAASPCI